jgi:hypothetical protein
MPLKRALARTMVSAFWWWIMAWQRLLESTFCVTLFCDKTLFINRDRVLVSYPTITCKNNETFHIFGHSPPCPHDQCWKRWVEFSLFSHSHNIELGVKGAFTIVSIIFAPNCRIRGKTRENWRNVFLLSVMAAFFRKYYGFFRKYYL